MDYFKTYKIEVGKGKYKEEMVYGLALVYNLINREVSKYLSPFKLSVAKFNVLMAIKHVGGKEGISQIDIGHRLIVSASNMTRILDKLERGGLILRSAQEGDRRINVVKVTKEASDILDQIWPGYVKLIEELGDKLEIHEQKVAAGLLIKWFEKLKE
jgi:DNA-binding MarR family transcriptional regulator